MALYKIFNGPAPTTASQVPVTTGTNIKTMLQVKPGTTRVLKIREWGISGRAFAAAEPGIIELCVTDVAATVTAHAAAGFHKFDSAALSAGDPTTAMFAVGTTSTGYTASAEGTVGTVRQGDVQLVSPTDKFVLQFPLDAGFVVNPSEFMRIRVKFGTAVDVICYVLAEA